MKKTWSFIAVAAAAALLSFASAATSPTDANLGGGIQYLRVGNRCTRAATQLLGFRHVVFAGESLSLPSVQTSYVPVACNSAHPTSGASPGGILSGTVRTMQYLGSATSRLKNGAGLDLSSSLARVSVGDFVRDAGGRCTRVSSVLQGWQHVAAGDLAIESPHVLERAQSVPCPANETL